MGGFLDRLIICKRKALKRRHRQILSYVEKLTCRCILTEASRAALNKGSSFGGV